ncbi:MAG: ribonuclease III [Candidatus Vogelbacteria bacterium CG22_combo_CG10-13_8_21_14_all_37_9]|uniref:Ribonuclease 3 n=1 Tax=Candidatus Vogelbacteria bacterium CG22_combo_CG10-13_8_21_14_all_37_9 TaxID=1975046 RepID=A0A2H0BLC1_9BACT|nr:MAG: ribonuclease III [bacterium CG10_37_50]PIP58472.1 MAG: ribonuclease III [Candidatus Vogelbacteria bacterium CG22_combo_CG10-13_8_21_14_all_37_9]
MDLRHFEQVIGFNFKDKDLLKQAFIHRSYLNEHKDLTLGHNERLEFLGDAVLELVVTDFLYHKYPDKPEGDLTAFRAALVNAVTLSEQASLLAMNDYLLLSKGEAKDKGRARQFILANTFESVVGALYLDQGYAVAQQFITQTVLVNDEKIVSQSLAQDYKSTFQKKAQEVYSQTPIYKVLSESGPDHNKRFVVGLFVGEEAIAEGQGPSKQEAEQEAAQKGLEDKSW